MLLKRILLALGVLLLAAVAAVAGILARIEPADYVALVNDKLIEKTGRELNVDGPIGYSLSLLPTVAAEGVRFQNAPWGSRPDMLTAKRIEIRVALLPLFKGSVEIRGLGLIEPDLLLETNAEGRTNWQFDTGEVWPKIDAPPTAALPPIEIRRATVERGLITIRNAGVPDVRLTIDDLALSTRVARSELRAKASFNDVPLHLAATLDHALAFGRTGAAKARLTLTAPGIEVSADGSVPLSTSDLASLDLAFRAAVSDWAAVAKLMREEAIGLPALDVRGVARAENGVLIVDKLDAGLGKSHVTGSVRVPLGDRRGGFVARLDSPLVDLTELRDRTAAAPAHTDGRVFSAAPIALAGVQKLDGTAELRIARLALRDGKALERVEAFAAFDRGKVVADPVRIEVEGKTLHMRAAIDASSAKIVSVDVGIKGQGIPLGALGALLDISGTAEGSPTDIDVQLTARGNSVRSLMAGASGDVVVSVGPGRIKNRVIDVGADVTELLNALNPARASDPYTELKCAVIRLPIRQGVARIDNSIAAETARVNVIAAGVIDLRNETLDLGFRPKAATGLGVGLGALASLVRLRGSLADPQVELDVSGAAKAATQLGIAAAKDGLSLLAGGLLSDRVPDRPCQAALQGTARAAPQQRATKPSGVEGLLDNIKGLFGR